MRKAQSAEGIASDAQRHAPCAMRKQFPRAHLPCALVLALAAMATPLPVAIGAGTPPLPAHGAKSMAQSVGMSEGVPQEAFDDSPGYEKWKVIETAVAKDGETARIRLRHPGNDRVIAVLQYRLISSIVVEERP